MSNPYQTVLTSIVATVLLFICILIYRYIYPRKKIPYFVLMIFISFLPLVSIFRYGAYESGDFNIHTYRTIAFFEAIRDGQLMPSWPKDLNATYGYPLFIWLNALPYYLISIFHLLGFSFIMSTKLFLFFAYILSGVSFWLFAKKQTTNEFAVFAGTIFYLFAPYHFVDLHFRAAIGETLAFAILTLFMLCIQLLWEKRKIFNAILLGVVWGVFILTHHAIAVFSFGLGILYTFFLYYKTRYFSKKLIILFTVSIIYGFLLSLYVWLPHLFMSDFTYGKLLQTNKVSFLQFWEFFFSPWKLGLLFQGPKGQLAFLIGYGQLIVILLASYAAIKKKSQKYQKDILFYLGFVFLLGFFMTPFSSTIWETIPLISSAQFSTRLMVLMTFTTSTLTVFVCSVYKDKTLWIWLLVVFTITVTILNWGHRRVIPEVDDSYLRKNIWASTVQGEGFFGLGIPKWTNLDDMWISERPDNHIEIIDGQGELTLLQRKSNLHTYHVLAESNLTIRENTLYFPGWAVYGNGKEVLINPSHQVFPGVITFSLPKGDHHVQLIYKDIALLRFAKAVSLSVLIFSVIYFSLYFVSRKNSLH